MMTSATLRAFALLTVVLGLPCCGNAQNLVAGGTFDSSKGAFWSTKNIRLSLRSGQLCADIPGKIDNGWDALMGIDGLNLVPDAGYTLQFQARATGNAASDSVKVLIQEPAEPWTAHAEYLVEPVEAMQPYSVHFVAKKTAPAQLVFQLGGQEGPWRFCIDDVAVTADGQDAPAAAVAEPKPADAKPAETKTAETKATETKPAEVKATEVKPAVVVETRKVKRITKPVSDPIRLNQLAFFPDGSKRATIISLSKTPLKFQLKGADGKLLGEGETAPRGVDPSSGYPVHVADFSAFTTVGTGYWLEIDGRKSFPFSIGRDEYRRLAVDALSWFYPQRSGIAITADVAGAALARPAGHVGQAPNQGDTAVGCLSGDIARTLYGDDWQCDYKLDVSGGWYDAGDHGKYVVNGGIAAAQMMAAFERAATFGTPSSPVVTDGFGRLPEKGNGVPDVFDEVRWELQFFLAMIVPEGQPLAGMVHHKVHDTRWTALPMMPHLDPEMRALHRPSTAATLNVAATAAQASRLFRPYDVAFADRLLAAARTTYVAARANPDLYAPVSDGQQGGGDYDDDDVSDEFYWAAAELFMTTGEAGFLEDLHGSPHWDGPVLTADGFDWRSVAGLARLQLGLFATKLPQEDMDLIRSSIIAAADAVIAAQTDDAFGQLYHPQTGVYAWGSNHLALQQLLVLAAAYDIGHDPVYLRGAREGMDYLLGRNALNMSFITGYGTAFSQNQHSRWYAHQLDASLPAPPMATLAGGPNELLVDPVAQDKLKTCFGQSCYIDDIGSWGTNEMTINWNAALFQAAAFLSEAE